MNFLKLLDKLVAYLLVSLMLLIVLAISWQVFARYILDEPSTVSSELARFSLMWIGMLGASYCYRHNSHLSLNVLTQKFSVHHQRIVELLGHLLISLFAIVVLLVGGCKLVWLTLFPEQLSPVLNIKMAYVYAVIPLSGLIISVFSLEKLAAFYAVIPNPTEPKSSEKITESTVENNEKIEPIGEVK